MLFCPKKQRPPDLLICCSILSVAVVCLVTTACSDPDQGAPRADHQGHLRPEHRPPERAHLRREQERPHRYLDRHGRHPAAPRPHRSQRRRQARSLGVLRRARPAREGRVLEIGRREAGCVGVCRAGRQARADRDLVGERRDEDRPLGTLRAEGACRRPKTSACLLAADEDTDHDGTRDKWETYEGGALKTAAFDEDPRRPARSAADLRRGDVDADREPA